MRLLSALVKMRLTRRNLNDNCSPVGEDQRKERKLLEILLLDDLDPRRIAVRVPEAIYEPGQHGTTLEVLVR